MYLKFASTLFLTIISLHAWGQNSNYSPDKKPEAPELYQQYGSKAMGSVTEQDKEESFWDKKENPNFLKLSVSALFNSTFELEYERKIKDYRFGPFISLGGTLKEEPGSGDYVHGFSYMIGVKHYIFPEYWEKRYRSIRLDDIYGSLHFWHQWFDIVETGTFQFRQGNTYKDGSWRYTGDLASNALVAQVGFRITMRNRLFVETNAGGLIRLTDLRNNSMVRTPDSAAAYYDYNYPNNYTDIQWPILTNQYNGVFPTANIKIGVAF